jgi:putative transposase
MKLLFRLVVNISGYGLVLNQFIVQYLESTSLSREICLLLKKFIHSLVEKYGKHIVYTDGGRWYDEACNILKLKHYLHSSIEKSLMERVNQYFKDRIEGFDDYYPCMQNECNLFHVHNWIQFFVSMYNDTTFENYFINKLNERGEYILS